MLHAEVRLRADRAGRVAELARDGERMAQLTAEAAVEQDRAARSA